MGRLFVVNLEGKIYNCKYCKTHLASCEDIVSKCQCHRCMKEERMMMTGLHTVADIFCISCGSIIGWKYETAREKSEVQRREVRSRTVSRFKVTGPDGSSYWASHEAHTGGSDADDA